VQKPSFPEGQSSALRQADARTPVTALCRRLGVANQASTRCAQSTACGRPIRDRRRPGNRSFCCVTNVDFLPQSDPD